MPTLKEPAQVAPCRHVANKGFVPIARPRMAEDIRRVGNFGWTVWAVLASRMCYRRGCPMYRSAVVPSLAELAREFGWDRKALRRRINSLADAGLLEIVREASAGRGGALVVRDLSSIDSPRLSGTDADPIGHREPNTQEKERAPIGSASPSNWASQPQQLGLRGQLVGAERPNSRAQSSVAQTLTTPKTEEQEEGKKDGRFERLQEIRQFRTLRSVVEYLEESYFGPETPNREKALRSAIEAILVHPPQYQARLIGHALDEARAFLSRENGEAA